MSVVLTVQCAGLFCCGACTDAAVFRRHLMRENCEINMPADPNNMGRFLELVHEHEKQLVVLLKSNGVKIRVFRDLDGLKEYMASL